jgi:DNA-binding transcriptional LysR family regulator
LVDTDRYLNCGQANLSPKGSGPEKFEAAQCWRVQPGVYPPFADGWHFLDAASKTVLARIGEPDQSSIHTMRAAAVAGIGLVMTAPFLIADLLESDALVPVPVTPGYRTQELELIALYPHRRHLSAKVRAFIDMLVTWFIEHGHRLRTSGS